MVFDILELNGRSLLNEPFHKRREILEGILKRTVLSGRGLSSKSSRPAAIQIAPQIVTSDPVEIRAFLKKQIDAGLEGIVAKKWDSPYSPGRTGFHWVKLKWEGEAKSGGLLDTVDGVVMGIYKGKGKRSGFGAGAFLVGILSDRHPAKSVTLNAHPVILNEKSATNEGSSESANDINIGRNGLDCHGLSGLAMTNNAPQNDVVFQTISKIGTGLTDEQWKELRITSNELRVTSKPIEYEVPKSLMPDVWMRPELVAEIQADNITKSPLHTAGYALRFPRLVRYRGDKKAEQATTREEIEKLYEMQ